MQYFLVLFHIRFKHVKGTVPPCIHLLFQLKKFLHIDFCAAFNLFIDTVLDLKWPTIFLTFETILFVSFSSLIAYLTARFRVCVKHAWWWVISFAAFTTFFALSLTMHSIFSSMWNSWNTSHFFCQINSCVSICACTGHQYRWFEYPIICNIM